MKKILVQDEMNCDELDLFLRSLDWSEAECRRRLMDVTPENQRSVIGQSFYNIRFPCMKLKHFEYHVKRSGVLTPDEYDRGALIHCGGQEEEEGQRV